MRPIEDKRCYNLGPTSPEVSRNGSITFEFHKSNGTNQTPHHHRVALGKPTPSKWDDAQKWLKGLSRGDKSQSSSRPRDSNADDKRLIAPNPQKEQDYYNGGEEDPMENQFGTEVKKMECDASVWRINKTAENSVVRSICVRDMGTEMTPIASQEPSRTATPIRATTPMARSPISSGSSTPVRSQMGPTPVKNQDEDNSAGGRISCAPKRNEEQPDAANLGENTHSRHLNPLEARAKAWDEAERAKYTARYKREEVKIQAWENHQKRKAEMEMKKMEVKAERMRARAQERFSSKLAATKRIAEEKRAEAEAKLNESAVKTSERADYIRRTGHLPSSFFPLKVPSLCW